MSDILGKGDFEIRSSIAAYTDVRLIGILRYPTGNPEDDIRNEALCRLLEVVMVLKGEKVV